MNGNLGGALTQAPRLKNKATARLGATMDFFNNSDFSRRDELDDLADLLDDHLNNALDGIWSLDDVSSIC